MPGRRSARRSGSRIATSAAREAASRDEFRELRGAVGALEEQVRTAQFEQALAAAPALRSRLVARAGRRNAREPDRAGRGAHGHRRARARPRRRRGREPAPRARGRSGARARSDHHAAQGAARARRGARRGRSNERGSRDRRGARVALALACAGDPPRRSRRVRARVGRGAARILRRGSRARARATRRSWCCSMRRARCSRRRAQGASHFVAAQRAATRFANDLPSQRAIWLYALGLGRRTGLSARTPRHARGERGRARPDRSRRSSPCSRRARDRARRRARAPARGALARRCADGEPHRRVQRPRPRVRRRPVRGRGEADRRAARGSTWWRSATRRRPRACASRPGSPRACRRRTSVGSARALPARGRASPSRWWSAAARSAGCRSRRRPGRGTVVVELDPPLRVEAYFAPGRRHVLQVVDFPALDPETRHWRWLDSPAGGERTRRSAP